MFRNSLMASVATAEVRHDGCPAVASGVVLGVDAGHCIDRLGPLPTGVCVVLTRLSQLAPSLLDRVRPGVVVAPLWTASFDIMELARHLDGMGYTNRLIAVADPLPDARLVEREVRAEFPRIDFCVHQPH